MNITDMIIYDEGEKLTIYKDTEGYWTIGVGHLLTKSPSKDEAIRQLDKLVGTGHYGYINKQESRKILEIDINQTIKQIGRTELINVYTSLDIIRRTALVNMCFQLGVQGVLQFKKMIQHLNAREYEKAADEALNSKWARQTPNRAKRVTDVIRYGDYRGYK
ncbi:TPA: glycoside hydrolase family protein [Enterobacter hormaechei subsp. steigerwaltii]|uniref:glycoside hydrolase family protein n=1 Tax=Enterobacter cloacae complex TaxID=354276 RepID=UPI0007950270|nr:MULTISPECIES: glycoside hydrolase family protein [Enterobacter cloacae complex]HAS0709589.1 glycoside hydrolase family protein [Enterobacter hormaechei subsp. steigerwaltii]HDS8057939.1 glycoside hydrolase family protein [Enterobacter hormaechei subsp. xiangfangensis]RTP15586.1 sulfurtransferase [Enterobacter hormaechei]SAH98873.1 muraminidase [Enterobacter cloacae]HAS0890280.1 glycoside hydrolase family protein [Enterobacter hormaechei subsp. steigerwaltii]